MDGKFYPNNPKEWDYEDIKELIETQYEEDAFIEYKRSLNPPKGKDKSEWNTDIEKELVAFANGRGGFLIFGIAEKNNKFEPHGIPTQDNMDVRVKQMVSGSNPSLDMETSNPISKPDSSNVFFIVKVNESTKKPVATSDASYYIRVNSSKTPMNRENLKSLFVDEDRRQQNIRILEVACNKFFQELDEYGHLQERKGQAPEYWRVNIDELREVLKKNSHLYSDQEMRNLIDDIHKTIMKIESHEKHYKQRRNGERETFTSDIEDLNYNMVKTLNKRVKVLKSQLERLLDKIGSDVVKES
jgi:predicted HTH transcriptional regulator